MEDTYVNMQLPVLPTMRRSDVYETSLPVASGRRHSRLPGIPNEVQSTSFGFTQPHATVMEQNSRFRGVCREKQSQEEECRPTLSNQSRKHDEKDVPISNKLRIVTYILLGLTIALSATLLIVFFVVGLGKDEEINNVKATIKSQQSNITFQISEMETTIENLQSRFTDFIAGMKNNKETIKILELNYATQTSDVKNLKTLVKDLQSNYSAQTIEPAVSCKEIHKRDSSATNGIYKIEDEKGSIYRTYCDMTSGGGGWTLVASVHENNLYGKCTIGDRWSSEHRNNANHPHGDGAWENTKIFGYPESATSDDYKNQGYFNMKAADVMIWHVPNDTPMDKYRSGSFMMYHTSSGFLQKYGGNLYKLFKNFYPLRDRTYDKTSGNGPSPSIVWIKGTNEIMKQNTPPNARVETTPGFVQFRAINHGRGAFAVCPGVKINPGYGNVEHVCIGGTSNHGESPRQCGDFAAKDWIGYATNKEWSANKAMTESVVMIFYR